MKIAVHFSPQALAQVQLANAWWKTNRPRAPRLFRDELAQALQLLGRRREPARRILIGDCVTCGA